MAQTPLICCRFFRPSPVIPGNVTELLQQLYYGHKCTDGCTHDIITLSDGGIEDILNDFALSLHNGELKGKRIHSGLYSETARKLTEAITKGVGGVSFSFNDPNNALRAQLISNVHAFSGAKSLTENAVFRKLLFDAKGELKPFNTFLNDVKSINHLYNKDYLSAEYNNAVAASQTALLWNQYKDDDWLEYSTAGDERVRATHRVLDGITMQKNSPFWNTHWPPNAWNCRCTVIPGIKPAIPLSDAEAGKKAKGSIDGKQFEFNSGQSAIVFKEDHPYFKSHKGTNKLDAIKNYGLKPVQSILKMDGLPAPLHIDTETDFYAWWDDMVKKNGVNKNEFVLTDIQGVQILFPARPAQKANQYFKEHILTKKAEARHSFAPNLVAIITNADEVWHNENGWFYLKYFNNGLYAVIAEIEDNIMTAKNMWKVDENKYIQYRKGILLK